MTAKTLMIQGTASAPPPSSPKIAGARDIGGRNSSEIRQWLLCGLLAAAPFLFLVFMLYGYAPDFPLWDAWDFTTVLDKFYEGNLSLREFYTASLHTPHRYFFPNAIRLVLAYFTHWNLSYERALSEVFCAGIFFSVLYPLKNIRLAIGDTGVNWLIPVFSLMIFSLGPLENLVCSDACTMFFCVFCSVLGLVLLTWSPFRWSRFAKAVLLGVLAIFSFGNGLAYWITGLSVIPFISRGPDKGKWLPLGLWASIGSLCLLIYAQGYPHHPNLSYGLQHPARFIQYVAGYLGGPLGMFLPTLGKLPPLNALPDGFAVAAAGKLLCIAGIAGLLTLGICLRVLARRPGMTFHRLLPFAALGMFSLCSACITGFTRTGISADHYLHTRYITVGTLLWVSVVSCLYLLLRLNGGRQDDKDRVRRRSLIIRSMLGVIVFCFLCNSSLGAYRLVRWHHHWWVKARADLIALQVNASPSKIMQDRIRTLTQYKLSVFRE